MPDPLPSILSAPCDIMTICAEHPVKMVLFGFFCGLATEAVVYLTGEAYEALRAYRDAIKAA